MIKLSKKNKNQLIIFIVIFFVILSIGYAMMTSPSILKKVKQLRDRYIVINQEPVNNHPGNNQQSSTNNNNNSNSSDDTNKHNNNNNDQHHSHDTDDEDDDSEDMIADVKFLPTEDSPKIIMGSGTAYIDEEGRNAYFDVSGLSKKGDKAIVNYKIINISNEYNDNFTVQINNENNEYFKIDKVLGTNHLNKNEVTEINVIVELKKTPITKTEKTSVKLVIKATPTKK